MFLFVECCGLIDVLTMWQVLIKLMTVKLPITEADAIRALACKVNVSCNLTEFVSTFLQNGKILNLHLI